MIILIFAIAAGCFLVERFWPAAKLPSIHGWWARIFCINGLQLAVILLAGCTWDRWLASRSLVGLSRHFGDFTAGAIAYFISTFVYYWWHRFRHESQLFWRLCHQLHHSPRRIEILTSFYKHPVEILFNSILSSTIVYALLGCSLRAAAFYTLLTAAAEFFYHWNIRTPRCLGYLLQRPESHRIHHQYRHHTQNFADLPLWDFLFGTFENARGAVKRCGFDAWREDRFEDLLAFRDVHAVETARRPSLQFLPTCIGCKKRWACAAANQIS